MSAIPISSEFALVAAGCRWPPSPDRDAGVRRCAEAPIDWSLFVELVKRHRVEGLVHRALSDAGVALPDAVRGMLSRRASEIGTQNLIQAAESLRLQGLLADAGISCIFLKGVALGALAFKTIGIKQSWDIDLLVEPANVMAAAMILHEAGYERSHATSGLPLEQLSAWMEHCKESHWTHQKSGIVVELHSGLVDNPLLLPTVSARSATQMVSLGSGREIASLQKDELFTYLCVHGAVHGWARLKWLADVNALISEDDASEVTRLFERANALGGGRCADQALLLCSQLLSLRLPPALAQSLEGSAVTGWLASVAVKAMSGSNARELDDTMFGTFGINLSHLFLKRGWRYRTSELVRKCNTAEDRVLLPLPRYLRFLYPALAMPLWVWRRFRLRQA